MSSFQASYVTATADGEDWVPPDDVDVCFQSKDLDHKDDEVSSTSSSDLHMVMVLDGEVSSTSSSSHDVALWKDLNDKKDEVSSTSSLSASPTRYDKFEHVPYQDDPRKIEKHKKHRWEDLEISGEISYEDFDDFGIDDELIRAGPILQVFSVTICNERCSVWEDLEIFGEISITDGENNTFYIYKKDEPELISTKCARLPLEGCPVTPVYTGEKVKFSLKDKKSGKIIFKGECDVDFSIEDAYASKKKKIIKCAGECGFSASMEYIKIPFAAVAKVKVTITDNTDRKGPFDIYGTIKCNDLVLFEGKPSDPAKMHHEKENYFVLSTYVLAVPIYSSLDVEIKLHSGDGDDVADDKFKIFGDNPHSCILDRVSKDKSYCISMYVRWILHEEYFGTGIYNVDVKWNPTPPPWEQPEDEPPSDEKSKRALVEVFSVFVGGGKSSNPLDLCGTIVVRDVDRDNTIFIFARNSEIPDELTDGQWRSVSLAWQDRWFVEKDFYMYLNLKDKYGSRVCRGHLDWDPRVDTEEWHYGRRLCAVIRGANGYFAAVHYSVFKYGKKAKVTVRWEGDYDTVVYGVIYASYCNREYPSTYDKEYYRSIIFRSSGEDGGESVKKGRKIPLSKSHVSAPRDCKGLRLDFNLRYQYNQLGVEDRRLRCYSESLEFKVDETEVKSIKCFSVTVEWPSTVQSNFSKSG